MSAGNSTPRELEFVKHKPFALLYEEILLTTASAEKHFDEMRVKTQIANLVKALKGNDFHHRVMSCDARHILTTNYDYNLEKATRQQFVQKNLQSETKYSIFRRYGVAKKFVWHIHGEVDAPWTLTLGCDQYVGYLQKLRGYATAERTGQRGSPFKRGEMDFDARGNFIYSWLDVFLRDDVHIIGLGLDFTEIDLWWVLTYKGRLKARGWGVGRTYFHDWHLDDVGDVGQAKRSLLTSLGVEVKPGVCDSGFDSTYDQFLADEFGV